MTHHSTCQYLERIEPKNSRMMRLRFNFKTKTDIIVTYAPPAKSNNRDTTKEETDKCYEELQQMIEDTPKNSRLIVMGDMNARIRNPHPTDPKEATIIGKHGLVGNIRTEDMDIEQDAAVINNRNRLINLCLENDLKIENTMFPKPVNKLATYLPLGISKTANISANTHWQIDYIMTRRDNIRSEDCETDTKAQLQSDHYPVMAQMKIKFKRPETTQEGQKSTIKRVFGKTKKLLTTH